LHPVNSKHVVNDKELLLVHVTHFNKLMWDNNGVDTLVIEHGVTDPGAIYTGKLERGIVVINNLPRRGRMLGYDLFREVRQDVPLDLAGMGSEEIGLGEVLHPQLPTFIKDYRFFFNPIRYTSLGLAVCEALMAGLPVVALATTEISSVIKDGVNGFIHTDPAYLIRKMKRLLTDPVYACEIG
jgi:glycosyltransferase involved in cell wall biosynthesis